MKRSEFYGEARPQWDGTCATCGHDYIHNCHGDCTCLSCNAQRQWEEEQDGAPFEDD